MLGLHHCYGCIVVHCACVCVWSCGLYICIYNVQKPDTMSSNAELAELHKEGRETLIDIC